MSGNIETVRPDTFTKWVMGVCGVLFASVTIGLGTTLWRINTSQVEIVTTVRSIDTRVVNLEEENKAGRRYTYEDAQKDWEREDARDAKLDERISRLEDIVYGRVTQSP